MADKNKAILEYLEQCPAVKSFLYFNSATERPGRVNVETVYSEAWEESDNTTSRWCRCSRKTKARHRKMQNRLKRYSHLWIGLMSRTGLANSLCLKVATY